MRTDLKATLEKALDDWYDDQCKTGAFAGAIQGSWMPDNLTEKMADAAEAVFDINVDGQVQAKANRSED